MTYIESKLYGLKTWMKVEIKALDFGIDIEGMQKMFEKLTDEEHSITRGEKREVVFPTIEDYIMNVKLSDKNSEIDGDG